jgi:ELWxxDGT repeat protein
MKPTILHQFKKAAARQVRALRLEVLENRCLLAVDLVADINQTGAGGDPAEFTVVGNTAFFAAYDITRGTELWKTDGTIAGTRIVKDIFTGVENGAPNSSEPRYFANVNGTLYFSAFDPEHGRELWKSDGTAAGTMLVKDIWLGAEDGGPTSLRMSGGLLYFRAFDPINGSQLWKSNGTPGGTVVLTQTNLGGNPNLLTDVNGTLYFVGEAGGGTDTLYRTTGGTPTTVPIPLAGSYHISELRNINGALYFTTSSIEENILWRTNGTTTTKVASTIGPENRISFLTYAGGTLYGVVGGNRLYSSANGTPTLVATFTAGNIGPLAAVGDKVFFTANDGINGVQLWVSGGTPATTNLVKVIGSGTGSQTPFGLTNVDGVLYFSADDGASGRELWKSDGTAAGTKLVEDLKPGGASSDPLWITNFNGLALFRAIDNLKGTQVHKSNGTVPGTFAISNLNPLATGDAFPSKITDVGGVAYFFADDGVHGSELWKSDGTAAGTSLVADVNPGPNGSERTGARSANVNGTLYFIADDGQHGTELWKSSGGGTSLVKDINPGSGVSNPDNLTAVGGVLYFTANDGANGITLWKSNGTAAGTISLGPANSLPSNLTNVSGTLFFSATDAMRGGELWKTNGTPAGTVVVRDIRPGSAGSLPTELTNVNGTLFFSADDGVGGRQLWRSNGAAAGTLMVQAMGPSFPQELTNVSGTLFFSASDSVGSHLWKSDGTAAGTTRVLGENPSQYAQYPAQMTNVEGVLYFVAGNDPYYDRRIWRSDGSPAGTLVVVGAPFGPQELTAAGSTLYFTVQDGQGEALWKSDGTVVGTVKIQNFGDGNYNYYDHYPGNLTSVGGRLFFAAGDLQHGMELRVINDGASAATGVGANSLQSPTTTEEPIRRASDGASGSSATILKNSTLKNSTQQLETLPAASTTARPKKRSDAGWLALSAAAIDSLLSDFPSDWR